MSLLAGTGRCEITPPLGVELMGYGARVGTATGVHDALYARALCFQDEEASEPGILIISADLCLMSPARARSVRSRIADDTGIPLGSILLSCTHTHSGPDTGLGAEITGEADPEHVADLLEGIEEAGLQAFRSRRRARFRWTTAEARIGRNRRIEDGPLDPEILILEVEEPNGRPIGVLFDYACHGTVLGHDNLEISADWAGVAAARIEEATEGTALFLLGAHADIDPRTRAVMDPAIDGQSIGLGFDAVRVLGGEVAEAVLGALERRAGFDAPAPIRAATRAVTVPIRLGDLEEAEAAAELERQRKELAAELGLDPEAFPRTGELFARVRARMEDLGPEEARELAAAARVYLRDRTASRWVGGAREVAIEVQTTRIGDAALLALPLEPTTEVGLDWKRRARARVPLAAVAGIGNGWLRYLPHARDLAHPHAHRHYEVLSSLFVPDACERLLSAGEELLEGLGS